MIMGASAIDRALEDYVQDSKVRMPPGKVLSEVDESDWPPARRTAVAYASMVRTNIRNSTLDLQELGLHRTGEAL